MPRFCRRETLAGVSSAALRASIERHGHAALLDLHAEHLRRRRRRRWEVLSGFPACARPAQLALIEFHARCPAWPRRIMARASRTRLPSSARAFRWSSVAHPQPDAHAGGTASIRRVARSAPGRQPRGEISLGNRPEDRPHLHAVARLQHAPAPARWRCEPEQVDCRAQASAAVLATRLAVMAPAGDHHEHREWQQVERRRSSSRSRPDIAEWSKW